MGSKRGVDDLAHPRGDPGRLQELEVERRVQFVGTDVLRELLGTAHPRLGHEGPRGGVLVRHGSPGSVDLVYAGTVPVRVDDALGRVGGQREGHVLDVGQVVVLHEAVGHVDAEPVRAPVEPEAESLLELVLDVGVVPVHVRLLGGEQPQVPLAGGSVLVGGAGPSRPAELAAPIVRRQFAGHAASLAEDEALAFGRSRAGGQGFAEHGVLVGEVVGDDVDDHLDPDLVRFGDQRFGFGQGAEDRFDVAIVGDVVAGVLHGGGVPGADPHRIDAEAGEVGQSRADAVDVADAVTVGVGEAAGIDLIDDGAPPP